MEKVATQLEITRHTVRRAAIWHFARWFFIPAFVLAVTFGGSTIALGESPWDAVFNRALNGQEVATIAIASLLGAGLGLLATQLINRGRASAVGLIAGVLALAIIALWLIALWQAGNEIIGWLCVMSLVLPFFVAVLLYGLRSNSAAWLTDLAEEDRVTIDEAARRF